MVYQDVLEKQHAVAPVPRHDALRARIGRSRSEGVWQHQQLALVRKAASFRMLVRAGRDRLPLIRVPPAR